MKSKLALILAFSSLSSFALQPGDSVSPDAIAKAEAIQGELPTTWEPGKVYLLECWATWCGPCIAAIPHVDALHDKFHDKGLRVIGMNVSEDGKERVAGFVKNKGDGMSYPVAYVGKGGEFSNTWTKAAGIGGIPHTFVVKDGKLLFTAHPMELTEEIIGKLLSGPEDVEKVITQFAESKTRDKKLAAARQTFLKAARANDISSMENIIVKMKRIAGENGKIDPSLEPQLAIAKKDWPALSSLLVARKNEQSYHSIAAHAANAVTRPDSGAPEEIRKALLAELTPAVEKKPVFYTALARLQWSLGQKDEAKQSAAKLTEIVETLQAAHKPTPIPPLSARVFQKALEDDKMLTVEELQTATREEIRKKMAERRAGKAVRD